MSCLQETLPFFLLCRIYGIMALWTIARGEVNKLLNSISTIYNVYCNETDLSVQCSSWQ
jgi:hypothetical protein